jgi:pimeloyl-ACP methyl ester carboxylesterase
MPSPDLQGPFVVDRQGCRLHYWTAGRTGPPVVLTHGYTMDHRMFDPQVSALAQDHRVLVWDVRGHGVSKPLGDFSIPTCADDLAAMVDHAGMGQAHHVGHSMGGHIVQELAFRQAYRVLSMVMLSTTCLTWRPPTAQILFGPATRALLGLWPHRWTTRQIGWIAGLTKTARRHAWEAASCMSKTERRAVWAALLRGFHHEPGYRIGCPLLIMHGRWDLVVGGGLIRTLSPAWAAREPRARYETIPWAAHNAGQDNPTHTNHAIARFLREAAAT